MNKTQFNRLSKAKQRVFIAQDVLLQLKTQKFIENRGNYVKIPWNFKFDYEDSGKDTLKRLEKCEVCAKGALACSMILNFNSATMEDVENAEDYQPVIDIFGQELWDIIECLFEGYSFDETGDSYPDSSKKVYNDKGIKYSIESIMNNIIRNGGKYNYNGKIFG
jgi:hypothetical protein